MSAIVIKEGLVHYEAIGRGKPLLFIHGWLGSWRYWVPAMEELSSRHRTYALDLWGFGDSDRLSTYYSVDAYVELLREFLDQLGIWRVPIVGHALGGLVALQFAAHSPDRVEQLMCVSVPLMGMAINRPLASFSGNGDALARLITRRAAEFSEVDLEARRTDTMAVTNSVHSVLERNLLQALSPLEIPVLLVYGDDDPLIKSPEAEWLQGLDDNVRSITLEGTQHFPMLEERNKFNRLLVDFLDAGSDLASLELKEEWQRRLR
jgi:pimeloyl-ACP methyl ester carboxylesterase